VLRDFCTGDPLLFSAHPVRGLPCCPDRGSTRLGALVVDVLKSGIYDLWEREAAQECSDETPSGFRRPNRGGS
jgi:hypothetical protein